VISFEDLTVFDLNLIRSNAVYILNSSAEYCRYSALTESVLLCVSSKGFNLANPPTNLKKLVISEITPGYRDPESQSSEELIKRIFNFIKLRTEIIKDKNREPTWSTPKPSWYIAYDDYRKPKI
jgi:hypothetical protein